MAGMGYTLNWRQEDTFSQMLLGIVEKDRELYYFKMGLSVKSAERVLNEAIFYRQITNQPRPLPVTAPQVLAVGAFENRTYLIREYIPPNSHLALVGGNLRSDFSRRYVPIVSGAAAALQPLFIELPYEVLADKEFGREKITSRAVKLAAQRYERDLIGLSFSDQKQLLEINKLMGSTHFLFERNLATSGLDPWRLADFNGRLYLLDTEWASRLYPRHYDLAASVARLWSNYPQQPEAATDLLNDYFSNHLGTNKTRDIEHIRGLLALRTVGEWRDITLGGKPLPEQHRRLAAFVISNAIWSGGD